jgi:hypothetical protein
MQRGEVGGDEARAMTSVVAFLLVGLAHAIGWGIRGNYGHEYGAMIPGALSALALCVVLPQASVRRRIALVGLAGAVGWSFGGSMSYGQLIGMTGSTAPADALYGFAMLGVIGGLWALIGGGIVALAVRWPRPRLASAVPPLCWVFAAWAIWELAQPRLPQDLAASLHWWGSDWVGVSFALAALLLYRVLRGRDPLAVSLMTWMAVGWWLGFLLLVVAFDLHMTPPRSDNWAGAIGMAAALLLWLRRHDEPAVLRAALVAAAFGAVGFMAGQGVAVAGRAAAPDVNWWSVMEQTFGFIAGLGLALAVWRLPAGDDAPVPAERRWTIGFGVAFLLIGVPWINIRKNTWTMWLPNQVVPESMHGLPIDVWFAGAWLVPGVVALLAIRAHMRSPLPVVPASPLGQAQALFLLLLWTMVIGNLSRYLPFPPGRLVTEGVIHVTACLASGMAFLGPRPPDRP